MLFVSFSLYVVNFVDDNLFLYFEEKLKMENIYKIKFDNFFLIGKVCVIICEVWERYLRNKLYNVEESKRLLVEISDEIKRKVKVEVFVERYKFVCVVWIG